MKKIIEHGYKYHMETKCPSCGCKFSYDWEDVLKTDLYHYGYNGYYTYPNYKITCPECGAEFQILNWTFNYPSDTITCIHTSGDIKNED